MTFVMSKLALNKFTKPVLMEPPDKKRKTELETVPNADPAWDDDDDLDILLTQQENLNQLDNLVASQQQNCAKLQSNQTNSTHGNKPPVINSEIPQKMVNSDRLPNGLVTTPMVKASLIKPVRKQCDASSSSSMPSSKVENGSSSSLSIFNNASSAVAGSGIFKQPTSIDERQVSEMKAQLLTKDGELKILRANIDRLDIELKGKRLEIVKVLTEKTAEFNKEKAELKHEIETLKVKMQFQEHNATVNKFYTRPADKLSTSSPTVDRSPVSMTKTLLKSPSTPKLNNPCPTTESFYSEPKPILREQGTQMEQSGSLRRIRRLKMKLPLSRERPSDVNLVGHLVQQRSSDSFLIPVKDSVQSKHASGRSDAAVAGVSATSVGGSQSRTVSNDCVRSNNDLFSSKSSQMCLINMAVDTFLNNYMYTGEYYQKKNICIKSSESRSNISTAILLLPSIDDSIKKFLDDDMTLKRLSRELSQSPDPTSLAGATDNLVENNCDDVPFDLLPLVANHSPWLSMRNSLLVLHTLVCRCRCVHTALFGRIPSSLMLQESIVIRPNISKIVDENRILDSLFQLTNHLSNHESLENWQVLHLCLETISLLEESCSEDDLVRFVPLLQLEGCISRCLTVESDSNLSSIRFSVCQKMMTFLIGLIRSRHIVENICTINEDCILLTVYSFCSKLYPTSWTESMVSSILGQVLSFLGAIISQHPDGSKLLINANCECSSRLIKELILLLQKACSLSDSKDDTLTVIRQGASLIHSLMNDSKAFVTSCLDSSHEYIVAFASIKRLFKNRSEISDNEVNDFWDIVPNGLPHVVFGSDDEEADDSDQAVLTDVATATTRSTALISATQLRMNL